MSDAPSKQSPASDGTLRIPSTQVLPKSLPNLTEGDILRFVVRSNPPAEKGLLYFQGQLIKASLPPHIAAGDTLIAQLERSADQILFRILEITGKESALTSANKSASQRTSIGSVGFEALVKQIESFIQSFEDSAALFQNQATLKTALSTLPPPTPLPNSTEFFSQNFEAANDSTSVGTQVLELKQQIENMQNALPKPVLAKGTPLGSSEQAAQITTPTATQDIGTTDTPLAQLKGAAQGNYVELLRATATAIRSLLAQVEAPPTPAERFTLALREQISSVLTNFRQFGIADEQSIEKLIKTLEPELSLVEQKGNRRLADALKLTLVELKLARENPENIGEKLEAALRRLPDTEFILKDSGSKVNPKALQELATLANRLEQLAQAQETMSQLAPIMHALGEPAFILFPMLFRGFLSNTEIKIDPDQKKKQGQGKDSEKGKDGTGEGTQSYQRIRISAPLPTLGEIEVDVAHSENHLIARFVVEQEEVSEFLDTQLEHLRSELGKSDFKEFDFSVEVAGIKDEEVELKFSADDKKLGVA